MPMITPPPPLFFSDYAIRCHYFDADAAAFAVMAFFFFFSDLFICRFTFSL